MKNGQIEKFNKRWRKSQEITEDEKEPMNNTIIVEPENLQLSSNDQLLKLIENGATIQELKEKLGLNTHQLILKLNSLKNNGYLIEKAYHDVTGTKLFLQHNLGKNRTTNDIRIYTEGGKIRFLVISDTHFGNINDRFDIMENLYEYAIKNNITSIIHLGDLIEGYNPDIKNEAELKMTDALETANYVIKNYPRDNTIINYILLGNHDFRTIINQGLDISTLILKSRLDMEFLGYNNATIELHKDSIGLQHPILNQNQDLYDKDFINYYEKRIEKPAICLRGHTHENLFYINNNIPIICTPALFNNSSKQLGAWDITLYFNYLSKIESIELQSLEVDPKINSTVRILHKFN